MTSPTPYRFRMNSASSTSSVRSQTPATGLSLEPHFTDEISSFQHALELQAGKNYMSGYLKKKNDLGPDKTPFIQRKWTEWYVELNGTSLMFWSIKSPTDCEFPRVDTIKKKAPNFINVADCNVYPTTIDDAKNTFILNSAGANRFFFQTQSADELSIWILALRLSCFEAGLLHERYTSIMLETELYSPLLIEGGSLGYSGFVEMRCSGVLEWCRFWMTIRTDSESPLISFSPAKYSTDLVFTMDSLQQAYAIFPDQDELIDHASVLRFDGSVLALRDPSVNQANPPFILVMAPSQRDMLTILIAAFDAFQLHNRPRRFSRIPLPETQTLYLDLAEIMAIPSIDESSFISRQAFLDLTSRKFGLLTSSPAPATPSPREASPEPESEEIKSDSESPEENEFEPPASVRKSFPPNPRDSFTEPPKARKSFSVSWKEQDEPEEAPSSKSSDVSPTSLSRDSPKSVDSNSSGPPIISLPKVASMENPQEDPIEAEDSDQEDYPKVKGPRKSLNEPPVISLPKVASLENSQEDSIEADDSDQDDYPKAKGPRKPSSGLPKARIARPSKPENSDSDSDSDHVPKVRVTKPAAKNRHSTAKQLESDEESDTIASPSSGVRPSSAFEASSPNTLKMQARPFSMAPANKEKVSPFPTKRIHPRSKVSLPTASDSSSDDEPKKAEEVEDDDAPIGIQADPNMMRASMFSQQMEYGPDGMPYYDPQAMAAFNSYNPALQRPSTLLEAQDFARYNDQMTLGQPRYGPLIQLSAKQTSKTAGGLVGAISAIEQQRAANKYTNANARMTHVANPEQDRAFERQKERYLAEQRAMASQSQIFPPDAYGHYYPMPPRAKSPYGNVGASLSAGSFYHHPTMMSPSVSQNHLEYPIMGHHPSYYPPQNRSHDDLYQDMYQQPDRQMVSPPVSGLYVDQAPEEEDDDKPVGAVMANKQAMSTNPMLAKGRYREHTVSQLKVRKDEDEDESESEPEIDDDVQETFDDFVDTRLQMKPYAFAAPEKVFQAFADHCQDADLDPDDVPDSKTFAYMMGQAGFVCKKRAPSNEEMWYNIAIVDDSAS